MGKGKKIGIGIGIAVAAFFGLAAIGASMSNTQAPPTSTFSDQDNPDPLIQDVETTPQSQTPVIAAPTKVIKVDQLVVLGESSDNAYQARFSLVDANQAQVWEDGDVTFTIVDSVNRILYNKKFSVSSNDFQTYQLVLTGQPILAYAWNIPTSDVSRGIGPFGTAKITFATKDGRTFSSAYEAVSIPQLTEEEIKKLYEDAYLETALEVGKTVTKENFEITLVRVGWFEHLEYDTWGDQVTDFRADLVIKNVGSEADYMPSSFIIIDSNSNQYDSNYRGTIDFRQIYPGVSTQGYALFEGLDEDVSHVRLFTKDSVYNSTTFTIEDIYWEFEIDL